MTKIVKFLQLSNDTRKAHAHKQTNQKIEHLK